MSNEKELNENKKQKLDTNASSFIPQFRFFSPKKKNDYSGEAYNLNNKTFYNRQCINNNMEANYYTQPYYSTNSFKTLQYQYQLGLYPKSNKYSMNNFNYNNNVNQNYYNNQYYNIHNNNDYNIYQNPQSIPLFNSNSTQAQIKQTNKNLIGSKIYPNSFIPKSMRLNNNNLNEVEGKNEEERIRKEEEENRRQMELEGQKRKEDGEQAKISAIEKKEYKYTLEYMMQSKNWKISNEDELLTESVKQHFKNFEEEEREGRKRKKNEEKNNRKNYMTKETKLAEEFKQKLEETIKYNDPIKRNLRGFLNMLTKDNYEQIKQDLLDVIRDNVEYQTKFLDVLFQKAIFERVYVSLYAKLCKELDKELPQKNAPKERKDGEKKIPKATSIMRAKLLDKCKEIFQIKKKEIFNEYIKEKDPQEREYKLKNFVLGNINFITELIKIKILSKKIGPICINNLFERYESSKTDQKLKIIYLQAIIIFTEKFGRLIHDKEMTLEPKEAKSFKDTLDNIFQKLEKVKNEPNLPQYIYYSIINLIEKRKNNYQMSKYEEYIVKSDEKQIEKELENQITQDNISDILYNGFIEYKDLIEEEGNSNKYLWKEIIYLNDVKEIEFDDILEGYFEGCYDFIERQSNIKYAKSYIKDLIEHYDSIFQRREKIILKNRLIKLFQRIKDFALEIPFMYDIYAYVIFIFLENEIMEVTDLERIIIEKDSINIACSILKKVYKMNLNKNQKFKQELAEFNNIKQNKELFKWVFNQDENEEEGENNTE